MIRVTVKLISSRGKQYNKTLARVEIFNLGNGTSARADYGYRVFGKDKRLLSQGEIPDFPRKRMHALDLLALVLVVAREKHLKKYVRA